MARVKKVEGLNPGQVKFLFSKNAYPISDLEAENLSFVFKNNFSISLLHPDLR